MRLSTFRISSFSASREAAFAACFSETRPSHTLSELSRLDVYCIDPINGVAFIPFIQNDQLAWFVFDLFSDTMLDGWRFHEDPLNTRRPLTELDEPQATDSLVV